MVIMELAVLIWVANGKIKSVNWKEDRQIDAWMDGRMDILRRADRVISRNMIVHFPQ